MTLIQRCTFRQPALGKVNKKRQLLRTAELAQLRNAFKQDASSVLKHVIYQIFVSFVSNQYYEQQKTSINCD